MGSGSDTQKRKHTHTHATQTKVTHTHDQPHNKKQMPTVSGHSKYGNDENTDGDTQTKGHSLIHHRCTWQPTNEREHPHTRE